MFCCFSCSPPQGQVRVPKPLPATCPRAPRVPCHPGKTRVRAKSHPHELPQMGWGRGKEEMGQRVVIREARALEFPWGACAPRASRAPQTVPRSVRLRTAVPLLGERLLLSPGCCSRSQGRFNDQSRVITSPRRRRWQGVGDRCSPRAAAPARPPAPAASPQDYAAEGKSRVSARGRKRLSLHTAISRRATNLPSGRRGEPGDGSLWGSRSPSGVVPPALCSPPCAASGAPEDLGVFLRGLQRQCHTF